MELDRRSALRAGLGRRNEYRISDYRTVQWMRDDDGRPRFSWLVEWSEHSVALVIEKPDTPRLGTRITPYQRPHVGWCKPVLVARIQPLSALLNLVVGEYMIDHTEDDPSPPKINLADRRLQKRGVANRRRSGRWETHKTLRWRVPRGRRVRESQLISRSLDGLVLLADRRDAPSAGARIIPSAPEVGDRFGFRLAVVRRTESPSVGARLIFAEIEA